MTTGASWLASRLAEGPPALASRIEAALSAIPHEQPPDRAWRAAADRLVAQAAAGEPSRETALTLLAADALITLACEYVAERAPERLADG